MKHLNKKYCKFNNQLIILGFGSIGQAVLPLILRHFEILPSQIKIVGNNESGQAIAQDYGINFKLMTLTPDNYETLLTPLIFEHDFVLNLTVDVSSKDIIKLCHQRNALYLDTAIETWGEDIEDDNISDKRTNYALRESAINAKKGGPTAVITHGANPGLISHFVKQALLNIAQDLALDLATPKSRADWAQLANTLGVKTIQTAEYDSQICDQPKDRDEFVNTWSVEGFVVESLQPAELGWGTHERHWPAEGKKHHYGCQSAIYLDKPSASVKVRTWTPLAGSFHGYLITHAESISLAHYLTLQEENHILYRPTVHYAYSPCPDAILSLYELEGNNWSIQSKNRLIVENITNGMDELGALLLGHPKGAYWFGSQLDIKQVWALAPHNNATTLQVAASVVAGMIWAIQNPQQGIVEPEMMDYEDILKFAHPYLGVLQGYYSDWTPLANRSHLHKDAVDLTDPWQFKNILV
jgi:homospermidine synthase